MEIQLHECEALERFIREQPACALHLRNIAGDMHHNKQYVVELAGDIGVLLPAFEAGLLKKTAEGHAFEHDLTLTYFLSYNLIEKNLKTLITDRDVLIKELLKVAWDTRRNEKFRGIENLLFLILNNLYETDIIDLLISSIGREFWSVFSALSDLLPYLNLNISKLNSALQQINSVAAGDGAIGQFYNGLEKLAELKPEQSEALLGEIESNYQEIHVPYIASLIVGLSKSKGTAYAYPLASKYFTDRIDHLQIAITATSCFAYTKNIELLTETAECYSAFIKEERADVYPLLARGYGRLLMVLPEAKQQIINLSSIRVPEVQYAITTVLHITVREHLTDDWYRKALNNLVFSDLKYKGITQTIDWVLDDYLEIDQNYIYDFLKNWLLVHANDPHPIEPFIRLMSTLFHRKRERFEEEMTMWLNKDAAVFHHAVGDIVSDFTIHRTGPFELSANILSNLTFTDKKYILFKILGYIYDNNALNSLTFSLLKGSNEDQSTAALVVNAFKDYIAYNYSSAKEYVKMKAETGTELEKMVAHDIIIHLENYSKALKVLPRLKEFAPLEGRLVNYHKAHSRTFKESYNNYKSEESSFMNFMTTIQLKCGKTNFCKYNGQYTEKSELTRHEVGFEVPSGEFIDPLNQTMMRLSWRNYKRENNNETNN